MAKKSENQESSISPIERVSVLPRNIVTEMKESFIDYAIDYSKANAPMAQDLYSDDVGATAAFLLSPLSRAITGTSLHNCLITRPQKLYHGPNACVSKLPCVSKIFCLIWIQNP